MTKQRAKLKECIELVCAVTPEVNFTNLVTAFNEYHPDKPNEMGRPEVYVCTHGGFPRCFFYTEDAAAHGANNAMKMGVKDPNFYLIEGFQEG